LPLILHIETATEVCSVCLAADGRIVNMHTTDVPRSHASLLTVMIGRLMAESGYIYNQLDAIAVSKGPGSYTGLRIGVAAAKGFCYALDRPLIAVGTLYSMARCMKQKLDGVSDGWLVPMIDARRMEVYLSVFNMSLETHEPAQAVILNEQSLSHLIGPVWFAGDGAAKFREVHAEKTDMNHMEIDFTAAGLVEESYRRFTAGLFEDMAYFEPFYLKEFVGRQAG
jgi:tRNA threonylcarbamoyladenosine biosynthesis protein TsaB